MKIKTPFSTRQISLWKGSCKSNKPFRLALIFFAPEDIKGFSMPLASISAFVKHYIPDIEVNLFRARKNVVEDGQISSEDAFASSLCEWKPDLVAISIMTPHWYSMGNFLISIKNRMPDTPILIGGYQAIINSHQTIDFPSVDFVCIGDGELPVLNIIRYLQGKIDGPVKGIWEKMADCSILMTDPIQIDDISTLPFPDYELYEENGRLLGRSILGVENKVVLPVITGRGCPYQCTYCSNQYLLKSWKNKKSFLRKYIVEDMIEELCRLKDKYQVDYFEFWDELFMSRMNYVDKFFELYRKYVAVPFSINSRVEKMTLSFCKEAAYSYCDTIWFGIESGDYEYRKNMLGRKMTNEQIMQAADNCAKAGINRLTFNIVGMPFEKKEQIMETLRVNEVIEPEFFVFFTYMPLRGTKLFQIAEDNGLLIDQSFQQVHYLDKYDKNEFRLNIKEHPAGTSNKDFNEVCNLMKQFQLSNNCLVH